MKKLIVMLILCYTAEFSYCAHIEYYAGGFEAQCSNYSEDDYYYFGPYSVTNSGTESLILEDSSAVLQASSVSRNSYNSYSWNNSAYIRISSISASMSLDANAQALCDSHLTSKNEQTLGLFYKIQPGPNESVGDAVSLLFTGSISIEPTGVFPGNVTGYLSGPETMDHLAITLGQLPPVTSAPDPLKEVWTMPNLFLDNSFYVGIEEINKFDAKIGDVIGLFIATGSINTASGLQGGTIITNLTVTFTVEAIEDVGLKGDLDLDGDVDLEDFVIFSNNWLACTKPECD